MLKKIKVKNKKNNTINLKRKKRFVAFLLIFLILIQIAITVLAKYFPEKVISFFASLNNYYYLDIISKVFFAIEKKLTISSYILTAIVYLLISCALIKQPRNKKEKRYNKIILCWRACFTKIAVCIILDCIPVAIILLALYLSSEYIELKKTI